MCFLYLHCVLNIYLHLYIIFQLYLPWYFLFQARCWKNIVNIQWQSYVKSPVMSCKLINRINSVFNVSARYHILTYWAYCDNFCLDFKPAVSISKCFVVNIFLLSLLPVIMVIFYLRHSHDTKKNQVSNKYMAIQPQLRISQQNTTPHPIRSAVIFLVLISKWLYAHF